jgi:hypothetical protein
MPRLSEDPSEQMAPPCFSPLPGPRSASGVRSLGSRLLKYPIAEAEALERF